MIPALYATPGRLRDDVIRIIDLWEMATGDSIKADAVRLSGQASQRLQHAPSARSLAVPRTSARAPRVPAHTNGSGAR